MRVIRTALTSLLMATAPHAASCHDYWGDGSEVDAKTKALCCGKNDCREVDPIAMHVRPDGLVHFDDTPLTIPADRIMPTPDGRIWRCVYAGQVRCLFAPRPDF